MDHAQLTAVLRGLELSNAQFARLIDVTPRTVQHWVNGERDLPGPVAAFMRLLLIVPETLRAAEIARVKDEANMFDGIYMIQFQGAGGHGAGMLVFDRGAIFGSDEAGGNYDGRYEFSSAPGCYDLGIRVTVPAGVALVQGVPPQPKPYTFELSAMIPAVSQTTVLVTTPFGDVQVQFKKMRDLPRVAA